MRFRHANLRDWQRADLFKDRPGSTICVFRQELHPAFIQRKSMSKHADVLHSRGRLG